MILWMLGIWGGFSIPNEGWLLTVSFPESARKDMSKILRSLSVCICKASSKPTDMTATPKKHLIASLYRTSFLESCSKWLAGASKAYSHHIPQIGDESRGRKQNDTYIAVLQALEEFAPEAQNSHLWRRKNLNHKSHEILVGQWADSHRLQ